MKISNNNYVFFEGTVEEYKIFANCDYDYCLNKIMYTLLKNEGLSLSTEEISNFIKAMPSTIIENILFKETALFFVDCNNRWNMLQEGLLFATNFFNKRNENIQKCLNNLEINDYLSPKALSELLFVNEYVFSKMQTRMKIIREKWIDSTKFEKSVWNVLLLKTSDITFDKFIKSTNITKKEILSKMLETLESVNERVQCIDKKVSVLESQKKYVIKFADFIVKTNVFKCNLNHQIKQVNAKVDIMQSNGSIINVTIPAGYCSECNCYFILQKDYDAVRKKGVILCQQITEEAYLKNGLSILNGESLKPESLLHQCGYNVNATENLSELQRHEILRQVVDNGLYSISGICSFLDWKIATSRKVKNRDLSLAIEKWEIDRNFISSYKSNLNRSVDVKSIKRKV